MTESDKDTLRATAAHDEYMAEAQRLVDDEVDKLFAMLTTAIKQGAGTESSITREGHTLTARTGGRTLTARVEAVTDVPDTAEKAHLFPTAQAYCTVSDGQSETARWELHRAGAGDSVVYTWMQTDRTVPITMADVSAAIGR